MRSDLGGGGKANRPWARFRPVMWDARRNSNAVIAVISRRCRSGFGIAVVIATCLLIGGIAYQLTTATPALSSITGTRPFAFVATLPPGGGRVCQDITPLPAESGSLRIVAATNGQIGPRLLATIGNGKRTDPVVGELPEGWEEGPISIPLSGRLGRAGPAAGSLCLQSDGNASVLLAGEADGNPARVDGQAADGRISVSVASRTSTSLAGRLRTLPARIGRGNASWIGPWTAYVIGGCLIFAVLLASVTLAATAGAVTVRGPGRRW